MPSAWLGTFTGTPWSSSTLAPVPQEPLQGCKACKVHSRAQPRSDYVETVQWKTGAAILHVQGVVRARKQKQVVETVLGSVPNHYVENVDTGNHWHTSAPSKRKTRPFVQWPHLASHKWDGLTIISSAVQSDCRTTVTLLCWWEMLGSMD